MIDYSTLLGTRFDIISKQNHYIITSINVFENKILQKKVIIRR